MQVVISETLKHVQPVAHAKAIGKSKVTFRGGGAVKVKAVLYRTGILVARSKQRKCHNSGKNLTH